MIYIESGCGQEWGTPQVGHEQYEHMSNKSENPHLLNPWDNYVP